MEDPIQPTPASETGPVTPVQPEIQPPPETQPQKKIVKILLPVMVILLIFIIVGGSYFLIKTRLKPGVPIASPSPSPMVEKIGFEKFKSEEEFVNYAKAAAGAAQFLGVPRAVGEAFETLEMAPGVAIEAPERVSETTVQVRGIDEPDIVKTDGKEIYFSSAPVYLRPVPMLEGRIIPPPEKGETKVIKAFPPAELAKETEIEKTGNLLLEKNILIIFTGDNKIYGFDVSDPKSPTEKWKVELKSNNFLVDARLYQSKIYFITRTGINIDKPCPIIPLTIRGEDFSVRCVDVYHPIISVPVDATYTAFIVDPVSGEINKSVSFVGSSGLTLIYMSPNALYSTYTYYEDMIEFFYKFFLEKGQDLVPNSFIERLKTLKDYDISAQAKMVEFQTILEQYFSSLSSDERLRTENEITNRMEDYTKERMRELEKTGIVKIALDNFDILANSSIPGQPLNQFSLDEYQNHLRVATTVGGRTMFGTGESANDVYILDSNLGIAGSIQGLGLGERIYSARFIEDKGYLVTFRQIDPFFVLDLSNPRQPQVKGELKIPGYSSYLHPITKDKILGIGKEGSQVKISLFDVISPDNPTEISKYTLDEYWSDILETHHAFLLDKDHSVFFLPGSKGGYVFSYQGNELKLIKAVAEIRARRAIYINDYMYIIGDNKLVVLNEKDWTEVNELEF